MPTSKGLRNAGPTRGATARPTLTRTAPFVGALEGNLGDADVRGVSKVITMTLQAASGSDTFKLRVLGSQAIGSQRDVVSADSDAFDDDEAAADIQAFLRTATGDSLLTVSEPTAQAYLICPGPSTAGIATAGSSPHGPGWSLVAVECVGCSVVFSRGVPTYMDATGKVSTANRTASTPGDQPGKRWPTGSSVVTNGVGQTAQVDLLPATIESAVGGDDVVTIAGTEVASGGTNAVVRFEIYRTPDGIQGAGIAADNAMVLAGTNEDADGDITDLAGLESATNYYIVASTQTAPAAPAAASERNSRPSDPVFFTTT